MAIIATLATGSQGVKAAQNLVADLGIFPNTKKKRRARDAVKNELLNLGVSRESWRNFDSNSVKAGNDLLQFVAVNPGMIKVLNSQKMPGNMDINRANVNAFISQYSGGFLPANNQTRIQPPENMSAPEFTNALPQSGIAARTINTKPNQGLIIGLIVIVAGIIIYFLRG